MSLLIDRLQKLGRAIKVYRGAYHPVSKKWIRPPNLRAARRIERYLRELGLDVPKCAAEINAFQSLEEFNAFMKRIEAEINERENRE